MVVVPIGWGVPAGDLAFKGHGDVARVNGSGTLALAYGNVLSGSAPSVGDLVIWIPAFQSSGATLTPPAGWSLGGSVGPTATGSIVIGLMGKVVEAGDLSSPGTVSCSGTVSSRAGIWFAFSKGGETTATAGGFVSNVGDGSAPSNIIISGATAPSVLFSAGVATALTTGDVSWSGATADAEILYAGLVNVVAAYKTYAGGAIPSVTVIQADGGDVNEHCACYFDLS